MLASVEPLKTIGFIALETPGFKPLDFAALLECHPDSEELLKKPELCARYPLIEKRLRSLADVTAAEREILRLEKMGIGLTVLGSETYPPGLRHLHEPPILLFYRGENITLARDKISVSIVGARKADQIACDVACDFAHHVASGDGCVVSGLAFGVDAHAHLGALQSDQRGSTVAVLGNGLEHGIYPTIHTRLAQDILDCGGLLLSQFPTRMKPFPSNFLDRNRVIAALSSATLIVQAAERSGALATARHAMELGRDVLVVPGAVGDARYIGSNRLIKQGAYLVSETSDLFALVPELTPQKKGLQQSSSIALSELQTAIRDELEKSGITHYDALLRLHPDAGALAGAIAGLEELNLVSRLPGNFLSSRALM